MSATALGLPVLLTVRASLTSYEVSPSNINVGRVQRKATIGIEYANFASSFKYFIGSRTEIKIFIFVNKDIHPTPGWIMVKIKL